jgi:hypothetical protein
VNHRYRNLTLLLLASATLARIIYLLRGPLQLFPDEAYYWQWSRHLALSYSDEGPMTAYIIRLFTALGGDRELAVRAGALLFGLGVSLLGYLLAKDIFRRESVGFMAAVFITAIPLFASGNLVMTYDTPQVFFWALTCWLVWRIAKGGPGWLWYLAGITLGLGFLTKYTVLLFLPSLLGFLLTSRPQRKWLLRLQPYGALLLLALVSSPVFIWNAQHAGATLGHVGRLAFNGGPGFHLSPSTFIRFLGEQAGIISPLFFFAFIFALVASGRRGLAQKDEGLLFLCWMSAPTLIFFGLWSLGAAVKPNWPVAGYFTATLAAAGLFHEALGKSAAPRRRRLVLGYFLVSLFIAFGLTLIGHDMRLLDVIGIHTPARLDPTNRALGWRALGQRLGEIRDETPGRYPFLLAPNYGIASELAFYVPGHPPVYCAKSDLGSSHQYGLWPGPEDRVGQDALFVQQDRDEKMVNRLQQLFAEVEAPESLPVHRRGEEIKTFYIYRCHDYRAPGGETPQINTVVSYFHPPISGAGGGLAPCHP